MIDEISIEPFQLVEAIPAKVMSTSKMRKKFRKYNKVVKTKLHYRSMNETYGLETYPNSMAFAGIEIKCSNGGCYESFRTASSKYLNDSISTINLDSIKLNSAINILKENGKLFTIYDSIYHGDKTNSFFLILKSEGSDIFIWSDDVKYVGKNAPSKMFKNCDESDFINDRLVIAGTISLFFRPGDDSAYKLANTISKAAHIEAEAEQESFIEMVVMGPNGLHLRSVKLETPKDFDLALNYGEDFPDYNEKLLDRLYSKNKGIVMLHGPPGTGKTHYIRSLLPKLIEMDKNVILIPKHVLSNLESPQFNSFMIENFTEQSTVFVIEDAESIISKRDAAGGFRSELVSTILNITDGILNDVFNIQVILTFNTELSSIDEALLRKGRLISKYEFGTLSRQQASKLAESLGFKLTGTAQSYTLADIYALGDSEEDEVLINQNISKQKSFVGF